MNTIPTTIILVLGYKLNPDGKMTAIFKDQIKRALQVTQSDASSMIVITGGQTRAGFPSEAEAALNYINEISPNFPRERILLETAARSTSEHPKLVRNLLVSNGISISHMVVNTRAFHVRRSQYLFRFHWSEIENLVTFDGVGDSPVSERLKEIILLGVAYVDPHDRWLMPILKYFFRNS
jgi:uncharacterized SAM-binding protein YcdF (DUF218 family)